MKKFLLFTIFALLLGVVNCKNPFEKEKKDNTPLLLGLAVLANQPAYEATVTIVGFLQQSDGTTIRDGRIEIKNAPSLPEYLVAGQGEIKEFTKCQTNTAPTTGDINKQDGQFTVTFKVNAPQGKVQ
ncbi:MAG: hypothetical protein N3A69_18470, partial [Leptospiraceae bacterium]|nr:hypothetical protein [Leptospiraceae bacterium]